jgi:hypothetical protein
VGSTSITAVNPLTTGANIASKPKNIERNKGTLTRAPHTEHVMVRAGPKKCFCQYENVFVSQLGHGYDFMCIHELVGLGKRVTN